MYLNKGRTRTPACIAGGGHSRSPGPSDPSSRESPPPTARGAFGSHRFWAGRRESEERFCPRERGSSGSGTDCARRCGAVRCGAAGLRAHGRWRLLALMAPTSPRCCCSPRCAVLSRRLVLRRPLCSEMCLIWHNW